MSRSFKGIMHPIGRLVPAFLARVVSDGDWGKPYREGGGGDITSRELDLGKIRTQPVKLVLGERELRAKA